MCKKAIVVSVIVCVLAVVNTGSAAVFVWTDAGDGNSWCNPDNWEPNDSNLIGKLPSPNETVAIGDPCFPASLIERGPIIDCDVSCGPVLGPIGAEDVDCNQVMDILGGNINFQSWRWMEGNDVVATVNISGGIIKIGEWRWSDDEDGMGILNVSAGSITCSRIKVGDDGGSIINISGSTTITVNGECTLAGEGDPATLNMNGGMLKVLGTFEAPGSSQGGGKITINLDAGTIDCGEFDHQDKKYTMDINEGMFIIDGNVVADINSDISSGYITGYDGEAGSQLHLEYDAGLGKTKVWATTIQKKAWNPRPQDFTENLCPGNVKLIWTPGVYADDHNVYFGPSLSDVDGSKDPCLVLYDNNNWTIPYTLEAGTTYYWRVNEVNDNAWAPAGSPWRGDIWQFTTNDGNAFDPYPGDYQTFIPLDATLHWSPGCFADSHEVYLGTDFDEVSSATHVSHPNVIYAPCDVNYFDPCDYDPCGLQYYTYYYWRVDEVEDGNRYIGKVWRFRTQGFIEDANRILWYKFDEQAGTAADDASGYEHPGSIVGAPDPDWDANGQIDGCLGFRDDDGYTLIVPPETLDRIDKAITVSVWIRGDPQQGGDEMPIFDAGDLGDEGKYKLTGLVPDDSDDVVWRAGDDTNDFVKWTDATPYAWRGYWHHVAFVKDETADTMKIYFDSEEVASKTGTDDSLANVKDKMFSIGSMNDQGKGYEGKLDDFRVYDFALPPTEIAKLFRGEDIELAWGPSPYNGHLEAPRDANLVWKPGQYVADINGHQVYFGTDYESVRDANKTVTLGVYKGERTSTTYDLPILELDTTYYWRIDEANDPCIWKGHVWRFKVADYLVVDDFESYATTGYLRDTWMDYDSQFSKLGISPPAAASLLLRTYLGYRPGVHTGYQSVEYHYGIPVTPVPYSVAWMLLPAGQQDWTREDVAVLRLFFYGQSSNVFQPDDWFYVGLKDNDSNYSEIRYTFYDPENEDMNDFKIEEWQTWDIALEHFTDSNAHVVNDVNLYDLAELHLGFRDKSKPLKGGSGCVFFDDIRLYLPICKPEYGPVADFSGDCIVGYADIEIITDNWLLTDGNFGSAIQKPDDANLLGWWKLDEGSGDAVSDSSSYASDGTIDGFYMWVAGHNDVNVADRALKFRHRTSRVIVPDAAHLRPEDKVSASAWAYYSTNQEYSARIVAKGADNKETFSLEIDASDDLVFQVRDANGIRYSADGDVWHNDWIHLAGTYDGNVVKCYANGELAESTDANFVIGKGWTLSQDTNDLGIGGRPDANTNGFIGIVDDVRVYNYALSAAEVAWLASDGTGYVALAPPLNLYDAGTPGNQVINFRDLAVFLESWRDKKEWP